MVSRSISCVTPEREDRVHVVLELPPLQDGGGVAGPDGVPEMVEVGVEVVIGDDEHPLGGIGLVVGLDLRRRLEPQGGLAAPLLAEDQRRRGIGGAAEELVPGRVVNGREAPALEHRVGLGILLAERVALDSVMLQELFRLHPWRGLSRRISRTESGPRNGRNEGSRVSRRSLILMQSFLPDSASGRNLWRLTAAVTQAVRCSFPTAMEP